MRGARTSRDRTVLLPVDGGDGVRQRSLPRERGTGRVVAADGTELLCPGGNCRHSSEYIEAHRSRSDDFLLLIIIKLMAVAVESKFQ